MAKFIAFLFVVFVIGIVAYAVFGQAVKKVALTDSLLWWKAGFAYQPSSTAPLTQNSNGIVTFQGNTVPVPQGFVSKDLSPFYQKIKISNAHASYAYTDQAYFTLRSQAPASEKINITGWKLKMYRGEFFVPRAVNDYDPFGISPEQDINIKNGDYVTIYQSRSPLSKNIRLNKCTGYLNEAYKFEPTLSNNCPTFNRNEAINFSGLCQNLLYAIGSCHAPTPNELNAMANTQDASCRAYADSLNYSGCYRRYRGDADFLSSEWRVWLSQEIRLDQNHDRVFLYDAGGKLVDEYVY